MAPWRTRDVDGAFWYSAVPMNAPPQARVRDGRPRPSTEPLTCVPRCRLPVDARVESGSTPIHAARTALRGRTLRPAWSSRGGGTRTRLHAEGAAPDAHAGTERDADPPTRPRTARGDTVPAAGTRCKAGAADPACSRADEGGWRRPHAVAVSTTAFLPGCRVTTRRPTSTVHAALRPLRGLRSGPEPMSEPRTEPMSEPMSEPPTERRRPGMSQCARTSALRPRGRAITRPRPAQRLTRPHGATRRAANR